MTEATLPEAFAAGVAASERLQSIPGTAPEYSSTVLEACAHFAAAAAMVEAVGLFSAGEDFREHSTVPPPLPLPASPPPRRPRAQPSLRYVLVPALHGEALGRMCPAPGDAERDAKREGTIREAVGLLQRFLGDCVDLGLAEAGAVARWTGEPEGRPGRDA